MAETVWRVYYADGSTFNGKDEPSIPLGKRFQVQIIVQPDVHHQWQFLSFGDYYLWRSDKQRWFGVDGDLSAMMALTIHTPETTCLLWGSQMETLEWEKIQKRVRQDFHEKDGERRRDRIRR